jgi:hypothetical protein
MDVDVDEARDDEGRRSSIPAATILLDRGDPVPLDRQPPDREPSGEDEPSDEVGPRRHADL